MKKENIEKIAGNYFKENERLLSKYNLGMQPTIFFPTKKKVPFLAKIAIKVLNKYGGYPDIQYYKVKK
jgi:hypothetical protein